MNDVAEETKPVEEVKQPNKNDLKKQVRDIVDSIAIEDGETPLFRDRVGADIPEGEKLLKGYVVLHNKMEEPAVQRLLQAAGDKITVYCEEWTEESKRAKYDQKKEGTATPRKRVASAFKGAKIVPIYKNAETGELANPRREGTAGHTAYNLLLEFSKANGGAGMPYEAYIEAGGRADHVRWDQGHNYVEIQGGEPEKAEAA
jgi:hypothetical protein